MQRKSLALELAETIVRHLSQRPPQSPDSERHSNHLSRTIRWFTPNGGTLLIVALLILTQRAWAYPLAANVPGPSATTINYQGRLSNPSGTPLNATLGMSFAIYDAATNGTLVWGPENHTAITVKDGLFSVGLGSQTSGGIPTTAWNGDRYLQITVGGETLSPRELIRSVPIAGMALTLPDGAVTSAKVADASIITSKIADGSVQPSKLDRQYVNKAGDTLMGHIDMGQHELNNAWNIRGAGPNPAQLHMPGSPEGNMYVNWHSGGSFVYGGGQESSQFSVDTNGNMWARGTKSAMVTTATYGQRKLYAVEAPDVRFSDEGFARLEGGIARISLEPIFLETIEGEYLIHITPYGNASLYVEEVGKDYFVVKAREGDTNSGFVWRLSAPRKGYVGVRLEEVKIPLGPTPTANNK